MRYSTPWVISLFVLSVFCHKQHHCFVTFGAFVNFHCCSCCCCFFVVVDVVVGVVVVLVATVVFSVVGVAFVFVGVAVLVLLLFCWRCLRAVTFEQTYHFFKSVAQTQVSNALNDKVMRFEAGKASLSLIRWFLA